LAPPHLQRAAPMVPRQALSETTRDVHASCSSGSRRSKRTFCTILTSFNWQRAMQQSSELGVRLDLCKRRRWYLCHGVCDHRESLREKEREREREIERDPPGESARERERETRLEVDLPQVWLVCAHAHTVTTFLPPSPNGLATLSLVRLVYIFAFPPKFSVSLNLSTSTPPTTGKPRHPHYRFSRHKDYVVRCGFMGCDK